MSSAARRLGAVGFMVALAVPALAQAACQQNEIAGRWDLYLAGGTVEGPWLGADVCTLQVTAAGVPRGSCVDDDGLRTSIVGGQMRLANNCRITGRFVVEDADGNRLGVPIRRATLARTKNTVGGVVRLRGDESQFSALFQMIKL